MEKPVKRCFKHWTPRYIKNRLALIYYEKRYPDNPWLTAQAISFLSEYLLSYDIGIEWGSGRSTAWLASRVKKLISFENDSQWFARVEKELEKKNILNVDYNYRPINPGIVMEDQPYFKDATVKVEPASLDFALVDGEIRDHCALTALDLLKPDGILVVDNANWYLPHSTHSPASVGKNGKPSSLIWREVWDRIKEYRCFWTTNGVTDTAIFFT